MTITIKPLAAVIAIALLGVLAGLAIGQVASADSATISSGETKQLRAIKRELFDVNERLGNSEFDSGSVRGLLKKVCNNTSSTGAC